MKARVLPREEWPRLEGTEAGAVWPKLDPENARVLVVEDDAGAIVATWTAMRVVHVECLWVAPTHRGSFAVFRRLMAGMRELAAAWGARKVITGSVSGYVTDLIFRMGGESLPFESFVLPLEKPRSDRALGRAFHRQLAALVSEPQHAEDPEHDEQVGRALRTAVQNHAPDRAVDSYNTWANDAGYEPIKFLGVVGGKLRADIVTAVIEMDPNYRVTVLEEATCQR